MPQWQTRLKATGMEVVPDCRICAGWASDPAHEKPLWGAAYSVFVPDCRIFWA